MQTTIVSPRFQLLRLLALVLAALLLFTACKSKAERVQEQLDLGQKYLTELNYTEAILAFTEAIEIDPESIPAYMGRAEAYRGTEQYEEAKTDYTTVIDKATEQPYTQAEAYLGRGQISELTADEQDALTDYEAAADALERVNLEKITDVTEQMLEVLKIKVYNAVARLSAFFGQDAAAIASYTKAIDSLNRMPDDAAVLDVPAEKVTSYTGRAASNLELEAYEAVLPDYDALIELGEDKISERDTLLAALSLAHSQAEDLGASDVWLEEVEHSDYAESIKMSAMLDTLSQAAALAAENGEDAYDDIRELLSSEEAGQAMRNLLVRGYQLRYYDENGKMLSVYVNETSWPDVHDEENGLVTAEDLAEPANAPIEEELEEISLSPLYVYYGDFEGRSREGEGVWYSLDHGSRDYKARSYDWENDEPVDGFAQQPVRSAAPTPAAPVAPVAPAVSTEPSIRITNITFDKDTYLRGERTHFQVAAEYDCASYESCTLGISMNLVRPDLYDVYELSDYLDDARTLTTLPADRYEVTASGSGVYQFNVTVTPTQWPNDNFGFMAYIDLGHKRVRSTMHIDAAGNLVKGRAKS